MEKTGKRENKMPVLDASLDQEELIPL